MHHATMLALINAAAALSWLIGTLCCFALVIQPHPNVKPTGARVKATLGAIGWCWVTVSIYSEVNGMGAFPGHSLLFGAVFALVWAIPCFAFLGLVMAVAKWVER